MKKANWVVVAILVMSAATVIMGQTSTFTYQGRFTDSGTPANGTYDMQFKLFDGSSNQVGSTITNGAVTVANGVFAVQLDFGAAAFSGADRFIEIGVRAAGSGEAYTVLSPRQQLTSAVYAIRAGSTTSADTANSAATATNATQLGGVAANQYVLTNDPRLLDARPPTAGSTNYIQNTNSQQTANFNINGNGTAGGTLSGNVVNSATDYYIAGKRVLLADGFGNTLGGHDTGSGGSANTLFGFQTGMVAGGPSGQGKQNSFFGYRAGLVTTDGFQNTFVGTQVGGSNTTGSNNVFIGASAGDTNKTGSTNTTIGAYSDTATANLHNATAIGYTAQVSQDNSLVLGSIKGVGFGTADTNVGIGTTTPAFRLTVKTPTSSYGLVHTDGTITVGTFVGGSTGGGWFGTRSNHSLSFFTNDGGAAMTLETSGFLRLNNVDAGGQLQLCLGPTNRISFCSSSLRYKTAIKDFKSGLNVVNRLRPITFDWKEGGMHDLGFGAEEIAAVEPLLVTRNDKGEVEGVKYDRITAVLVNAVKEQQQQIQIQAQELKDQQQQFLRQQSQLSQQQREIEGLKRLLRKQPRRTSLRGK
jgi:hypothetical protein